MGGMSIWQLAIILSFVAIPLLIFAPISKKAGFSGWWALIMVIPLVNLIMIWVFALVRWPNEEAK